MNLEASFQQALYVNSMLNTNFAFKIHNMNNYFCDLLLNHAKPHSSELSFAKRLKPKSSYKYISSGVVNGVLGKYFANNTHVPIN